MEMERPTNMAADTYDSILGLILQGTGSNNNQNNQQVQYALVSFHLISKMVPNWSWATFEHMNNPGRCDVLGCNDTFGANPSTVAPRSLRLIILSQIIIWVGAGTIKPQLINVLSQIAFTYTLTYLFLKLPWRHQAAAAVVLLAGWTALFFAFPGADGPFSHRNHIGLVVDRAIFHYDYDPAYSTLNFIPSTVWTLSGAWAGRLLMQSRAHADNLKKLAGGMVLSFAVAFALRSWIPFIKQLCTASFILYSLGWVLFMLIGFYLIIEVLGYRKWSFPLLVVGMNSIFIYFVSGVLRGWLDRAVGVFTFHYSFIGTLAPVAQATTVLLVMWYLCYWLYQRRIFLKL